MPFPSTSVYFKWDKRCLELVGLALTTLKEEEMDFPKESTTMPLGILKQRT